ncbi:MAG TPA: TVP38/TMEM64 family protein [Opitutaceae bacterium]
MNDTSSADPGTQTAGTSGRLKIMLVAIAVIGLIAAGRFLPIGAWLQEFNAWVSGLGAIGLVVFVAVYVLAAVLFVPGSALTLGAGFVFGVVKGFVVVSIGATLGAAAAFLVSRHLAREAVSRRLARSERFQAVDRAIGREGAKVVLLLRLSPVFPYNALNYLLGLTSVRFWPFTLASWVGMLPGTLLYVYLGHAGRAGLEAATADHAGDQTLRLVYLGAGLLATLAVTIYVTRLARRELRRFQPAGDS